MSTGSIWNITNSLVAVIPAEPGWDLVYGVLGKDGKVEHLGFQRIIGWVVRVQADEDDQGQVVDPICVVEIPKVYALRQPDQTIYSIEDDLPFTSVSAALKYFQEG